MTIPHRIAKESEHSQQAAFIAWCRVAAQWGIEWADMWCDGAKLPEKPAEPTCVPLLWAHAVPNGGARGDSKKAAAIRGAQLKAEGVKSGVADVFIPYPNDGFHGLYIEFKRPNLINKGYDALSPNQKLFALYCKKVGFMHATAFDWLDGVNFIKQYLNYH